MKTEQYSFGKARLKANNTCRWSTVRWGFIFIFISLYISLHCCMSEVNQIVLPGHLTITDCSTGSYVWERSRRKLVFTCCFLNKSEEGQEKMSMGKCVSLS